ncbi:MAG TPA: hypothetical protein DCM40_07335, partial [Maribacter sp.]|nr:hypothetical protein [Maribacter sp.]
MAEQDPCELFPEEEVEEEEVEPENEDTGGSALWRNPLGGIGPTAGDLNENALADPVITDPGPQYGPEDLRMTEEASNANAAAAAERISGQINGDFGESLEGDISLTPVTQNLQSAGRSTWVVNNSGLLDFG